MFNFLRQDGNIGFVFFNCDDVKSRESMNLSYNNVVYRDRRDSRRELWKKIKEQLAEGNIQIDESKMQTVREAILSGNPREANNFITYGAIVNVEVA